MFEAIVNYAHVAIAYSHELYLMYAGVVMLRFSHSQLYPLFGNAIAASLKVYETNQGKPKQYWAHSFTLVLITGFGGGFVAPMMLGKPCAPVANDAVVPTVLVTWYLIHYLGFNKVFSFLPIKIIWSFFVALFRTHAVCNMVVLAADTLKAGPYYPCALVGPIVIGTAVGSLGQFFPTDKGLEAVTNGLPWPVQGALMTSIFYHLTVNDKEGFVGIAFRSVFGSHTDETVRVIVASVQIVTLLSQTILAPSANLFTPFHKLLYLIFQVEGPKGQFQKPGQTVGWAYTTRLHLERIIESSRILAVIAAFGIHLYYTQPKSMITTRGCDPYILTLESVPSAKTNGQASYKLSSYKSLQNAVLTETSPLWQTVIPSAKVIKTASVVSARISEDGKVRVISSSAEAEQDELLWSSTAQCPTSASASPVAVTLSIDPSGKPMVTCSDGSTLLI